jgi:hypothetical protein
MAQIDAVRQIYLDGLTAGANAADSSLRNKSQPQLQATRAVEAMVRDRGNAAADQQTRKK